MDENKRSILNKWISSNAIYKIPAFITTDLLADKEFMVEAFKKASTTVTMLDQVSPELKKDKDVVLAAVIRNVYNAQYIDDSLFDDKDVVMAIISSEDKSFSGSTEQAKCLKKISSRLKDDKDVALSLVGQYGPAIQLLSERLRNDRDIVMTAVKRNCMAYKFVSPQYQLDEEIFKAAFMRGVEEKDRENWSQVLPNRFKEIFPAEVITNKKCMMFALSILPNLYEKLPHVLKEDVDIFNQADEYGQKQSTKYIPFKSAPYSILSNKDIVSRVLRRNIQDGPAYSNVKIYRINGEMICYFFYSGKAAMDAVNLSFAAMAFPGMSNDQERKDFNEKMKKNPPKVYPDIIIDFPMSEEEVERVLAEPGALGGSRLSYFSNDLAMDRDFVLRAVSLNAVNYASAGYKFRLDKEVVMMAIKNGYVEAYHTLAEDLKRDRGVIITLLTREPNYIGYVPLDLRNDKEFASLALNTDKVFLQYIPLEFRKDKDYVLEAMKRNINNYQYASKDLRNDKEITLMAVGQNGLLLEFASDELKKDLDVVKAAVNNNSAAKKFAALGTLAEV